jgi:ribonuclease HI
MQHDRVGKIAYAIVMASRKLRHYFEAFKVRVTSDRGLGELFRNPEASVRIAKWAAELSKYHITFEPRTTIKSQVLADFIIDWTGPARQQEEPSEKVWTIHCDDAWCYAGAGAAAIITSPTGVKHKYAARLSFALESDRCTNNIAEYEAVILGLRKLKALGVTTCIIKTDSKVVAGQAEKDYSAKDPALMQYLTAVRSLEKQFKGFTLQHVDRARNEEADALAKTIARGKALPSDVFYHVIGTRAVRNLEGLQFTTNTEGHRIVNLIMNEDWRAPITLFLQGYYHPGDVNEAKRLKHQSRDFTLIEGHLYKKGISQPMLKCVTETEGLQILREVHIGTCGSHCQGDPSRFLLARYNLRHESSHEVVRSLPEVSPPYEQPFAIHEADRPHMATSTLGARHCRPTTHGPREPQVYLRRCQVFYQVDRGKGSIHNNVEDCPEILLAKHYLPIWSPVRAHSRQWQTV